MPLVGRIRGRLAEFAAGLLPVAVGAGHRPLKIVAELLRAGAAEGAADLPVAHHDAAVEALERQRRPGAGIQPRLGRLVVGLAAGRAVGVGPPELVVAAEGGLEIHHRAHVAAQRRQPGHGAARQRRNEHEAPAVVVEHVVQLGVGHGATWANSALPTGVR